jgi:hypothetical protein
VKSLRLLSSLIVFFTLSVVSSRAEIEHSPRLVFEFALKLPDFPTRMAWSPDNRFLAVSQFNTGDVRIVDILNRQLLGQPVARKAAEPILAWSSDSRFLALNALGIRILDSTGWHEIARIKSPTDSCWFQGALAFTPDGRFLWATCRVNEAIAKYTAALKFRMPALEIEDRLDVDPPVLGAKAINEGSSRITSDKELLSFASLVSSCPVKKNQNEAQNCDRFLVGYDLNDKSSLFSAFTLADKAGVGRWPAKTQTTASGMLAVVAWTPPIGQPPHGPLDIRLETYDTRSGKRLAAFGGPDDVGQAWISDLSLSRSGELVIGALSALGAKPGGLRVWEAKTGKLLQSISTPSASWLLLSQDGTRLAVIIRDEMRVFRVRN